MEQPPSSFDVSVSIISHGDAAKIPSLLDSLRSCEPGCRFQILLTDNLKNDVPEFPGQEGFSMTVLRNDQPLGFARNNNIALQKAEADVFCILNPDVLFSQPVMGRLITLLDKGQADIAAPAIVDAAGAVQDSFRLLPKPMDILRRKLPGHRNHLFPADEVGLAWPDWIAGTFMLMKKGTYHHLNGFDERFHLYYEDVDLCTRARLLGLKIAVDTTLRLRHDAQRASRRNLQYLLWHIQSAIRFYNSKAYREAVKKG